VDRRSLLEILDAGLRAADGRRCVRDCLVEERPAGPIHLIAVGKCASAMAAGATDALGKDIVDGLIVTRHGYAGGHCAADARFRVLEASHPVPDESSLAAGERLMAYVGALPRGAPVLALISGGASSLVEVLPPGVGIDVLERANRWLLGSGLDIFSINAVRRRMSRIKNGGLASALWGRPVLALYVSDVRGDDPAWIGSGLLQRGNAELPEDLPGWMADCLGAGDAPRVPVGLVKHRVVANLGTALDACASRANGMVSRVTVHPEWLEGQAEAAALRIVDGLQDGPPGIHLWGGETTVTLPQRPGRGGRSQHLALCCAMAIRGRIDLQVLCSATDGTDGSSEDAGALVDGNTVGRGVDGGLDPAACLAAADAGSFLEASGDLLYTGPTTTNVNDIVIGVRGPSG
jgi:hydroxypyruvate reductase